MIGKILIVEDDPVARKLLAEVLVTEGHEVVTAGSAEEACAMEFAADVVVTDVRLGGMSGIDLLRELKTRDPAPQVIVVTAFGSLHTALEAIRCGAFDYVSKPFRMEEMRTTVGRALDSRRQFPASRDDDEDGSSTILGRSPAMAEVFKSVARVAPLRVSVLIQGETGTGKELVARAIHEAGPRAERPYVTINCASLPEGLFESELFGHAKGAFTGALQDSPGLFDEADGGTILLDEIGDMPMAVQAKLLRVLEEGEIRPVGSTKTHRVDVRVLAATHRDLQRAVESGAFRQDLFFRLNAVGIDLPPLRDRQGDIVLLANHFLKRHATAAGTAVPAVTEDALRHLESYGWPGNVRELSHVLERAIALANSSRIGVEDLPVRLREPAAAAQPVQTLDEVEKAHILATLRSVDGSRVRAAAILGIDRKTLYRKLLRYGIGDEGAEGA